MQKFLNLFSCYIGSLVIPMQVIFIPGIQRKLGMDINFIWSFNMLDKFVDVIEYLLCHFLMLLIGYHTKIPIQTIFYSYEKDIKNENAHRYRTENRATTFLGMSKRLEPSHELLMKCRLNHGYLQTCIRTNFNLSSWPSLSTPTLFLYSFVSIFILW